jgi:hypothetical protein
MSQLRHQPQSITTIYLMSIGITLFSWQVLLF